MWNELLEELLYVTLVLQLVSVNYDQFPFTLEVKTEVDPLTCSEITAIPQEPVSVFKSYVDYLFVSLAVHQCGNMYQ